MTKTARWRGIGACNANKAELVADADGIGLGTPAPFGLPWSDIIKRHIDLLFTWTEKSRDIPGGRKLTERGERIKERKSQKRHLPQAFMEDCRKERLFHGLVRWHLVPLCWVRFMETVEIEIDRSFMCNHLALEVIKYASNNILSDVQLLVHCRPLLGSRVALNFSASSHDLSLVYIIFRRVSRL